MAEAAKPLDFVVKSSINIKSAGDPKKVAANLEHDGMRAKLSTILGIATGINKRTDQKTGGTYEGLVGAFAVRPEDKTRAEVRSNICYLPDAVHGPIASHLKAQLEKDPTAQVRFVMESYVVKGGTAGFTWEYKPMFGAGDGVMIDPLAQIRSAVESGAKALPAPTAAEKDAAAHVAETAQSSFDKRQNAEQAKGSSRKSA